VTDSGASILGSLVDASHVCRPDELPRLIVDHGKALGASDVVLYLVDYDQRVLVSLPRSAAEASTELSIEGTVAGRAFRTITLQEVAATGGGRRLWVPLVDGTERLGVLSFDFGPGTRRDATTDVTHLAGLVAMLVVTKTAYGDRLERVRRRQPMSLAAELAWQLLPPLTFGSDRVVISAALTPTYDLGGDSFDYAVDADVARFAVFDAMGHGLPAGIMSTIAVAAYRNGRRRGDGLLETVALIDRAIETHVGDGAYVTGVVAELDLVSGRLRWCTAGHPRPLLLRDGRIVRVLDQGAGIPFGLGLGTRPGIGEEALERGDRVLLYTDGIVEARSETGDLFGVERFIEVVHRASSERAVAPETLRRLIHAVVDHQFGALRDDATVLMVEWPGDEVERLTI
jgi:serine phosphatase RsbU (regulator of sigma subunit)